MNKQCSFQGEVVTAARNMHFYHTILYIAKTFEN